MEALGFGSLRGQLASLVAEKAAESAKRKDAEAEAARQTSKRARCEQDRASLQADAEKAAEAAQSELRQLRAAYDQLLSDHEQEAEQRQAAQGQLKSGSEKVSKLAAELVAVQTAARTVAAKLSQAEVKVSGFSHASASFEQSYNTVQQQIAQIRSAGEKHAEHQKELQQANTALVDALRKSDAELSGYRDRDDASARSTERATAEKERAQQQNSLLEAEIIRLKRELELEKELNRRNASVVQHAESERASVLHILAEYDKIDALRPPANETKGADDRQQEIAAVESSSAPCTETGKHDEITSPRDASAASEEAAVSSNGSEDAALTCVEMDSSDMQQQESATAATVAAATSDDVTDAAAQQVDGPMTGPG